MATIRLTKDEIPFWEKIYSKILMHMLSVETLLSAQIIKQQAENWADHSVMERRKRIKK